MNWIEIKHKDIFKNDYINYYNFAIKSQLKHDKKPIVFMLLCLLVFIASLMLYKIDNGTAHLVSVSAGLLGLLYYPAALLVKRIMILNWFKKNKAGFQNEYKFAFDENGIYYQGLGFNSQIKWDYYSCYEINSPKKAIYVYDKTNQLGAIYLERLLGETEFQRILEIIMNKLPGKKY